MKNSFLRRSISLLLSLIICLSTIVGVALTASAASTTGKAIVIGYPRNGDANYSTVTWGHDELHYYLLYNGDFAYNKSYSNDYAWGAVKRLDKYEKGCLSSLYFVFRPNDNVDSDYLTHYFESSKWHKGISNIAGEGARNHGLLNMSVDDYFATKHCLPSLPEQKKIARFFNAITRRIEIQNKIIPVKKSQIISLVIEIAIAILSLIGSIVSFNSFSICNNLIKLLWTIFKEVKRLWSQKKQ